MKKINNYIQEKLKLNKEIILNNGKSKTKKTLFPKDKMELKQMIADEVKKNGPNCSLNHIDVSKITNFSNLFNKPLFISNRNIDIYPYTFNGDISEWDVSKVEFMNNMFAGSNFNSDISNWKINPICKTTEMFRHCPIKNEYKPKSLQD